ncbi:MAG: NlpC/P60 family protein [Pseudomonadota bacterium]
MSAEKIYQIHETVANVYRAARPDAPLDTQVLYGERVEHVGTENDWARVRLLRDDYIGFMPINLLKQDIFEPTHRVIVPRTLIFAKPDLKTPPVGALTMAAEVRIIDEDGKFSRLSNGGFAFTQHFRPLSFKATDFVAVAEQFLHAPYLWGGRSVLGIDCSGLVQTSLLMAGQRVPRDSGPQEKALGEPLPQKISYEDIQRGDLLFWPGHVAIARGYGTMIHATAHVMQVTIESINKACERILEDGTRLSCIKRL